MQTIIVPNEPKTGAGGLIRQQRKSKQKGPKRLVKDGPLKEKSKKDIINEDDEIEGKYFIEIEDIRQGDRNDSGSEFVSKSCNDI